MNLRRFILLVLFCIALSSCAHIEPPHFGVIKDAETQEPLDNAIVYLELDYTCYFPPNPAGPNSYPLGNIEVKTDDNGKFFLPPKIYLLPPLLCLTDKNYTYAKTGYFKTIDESNHRQINLFKMNHYLNLLPYKSDHFFLSSAFEEKSKLFKPEVDKFKKKVFEPLDGIGIFLRLPGIKITRIYARSTDHWRGRFPDNMIYHVQDDISKAWLTFDSRGKMIELKSDIPDWDFFSSHMTWSSPLYATHDSIFYPIDENPRPMNLKYKKGELRYIPVKIGDISALAGVSNIFFTIEDNGNALCHYGTGENPIPHFLECFAATDLPASKDDDTVKDSIFKYALSTPYGKAIVTKSQKYWHIYNFGYSYDAKSKSGALLFTEILALPSDKEITAFTATGNEFFIAIKGEGLKKFRGVKEDTGFSMNARMTRDLDIKSLIAGRAGNVFALYATIGEDSIYRFSMDGIPDYIIKQ